MTEKENNSGINKKSVIVAIIVLLLAAAAVFALARPHYANGAEKKVAAELDALKNSDYVGADLLDLRESLSEQGRKNFDKFLVKLKDFDYEITGSTENTDSGNEYTAVNVKIKTYGFGKEYLAVWTEYLRTHKDALQDDEDLKEFYELLFERLAGLEKKDCLRTMDIICIDPIDSGDWIANIKDNSELQDAIFGGMMSEMEKLAAE